MFNIRYDKYIKKITINTYYWYFYLFFENNKIGETMKNDYLSLVEKHTPKEDILKNSIISFLFGGTFGALSELLLNYYIIWFDLPRKEAGVAVIITLIIAASIMTALGFFDVLVSKLRCALIIPITGFAHSITSAALDYRKEGFVLGIGANIFKLAGTVILYGIVSVYVFGIIRLLVMGG